MYWGYRSHRTYFNINDFTTTEITILFVLTIFGLCLAYIVYSRFNKNSVPLKEWQEAEAIITGIPYELIWPLFIFLRGIGPRPIVYLEFVHPLNAEVISTEAAMGYYDFKKGDKATIKFNPENYKEAVIIRKL